MKIIKIIEKKSVIHYLEKRHLIKQYIKAKSYIASGHFQQANLKLRQPKEAGIYSFRINKQFPALAIYKKGVLRVAMIDNHQN